MKSRATLLLAVLGLLALLVPGTFAEGKDIVEGEAALGAQSTNTRDSQNRASEYSADEGGAAFSSWWDIHMAEGGAVQLDLFAMNELEQRHRLRFDSSQSWMLFGEYNRFVHNLPHDPLTNLEATDLSAKYVRNTDMDPDRQYGTEITETRTGLRYRPVSARAWEMALIARRLKREGTRQHTTTSHCQSCHVIGQTRVIDEETNDLTLRLARETQSWGVSYEGTFRDFNTDADTLDRYFEPAIHPGLQSDVFQNRVQYTDETIAVGMVPETKKQTHVLRFYAHQGDHHFDGVAAMSESENQTNGLRMRYRTLRARWLTTASDQITFALHGQYEKISSDDVFVDVFEGNLPGGGPSAGQTFYEYYANRDAPGDYTRRSAADRKTAKARADLVYRYGEGKRHRAKISLLADKTDRDHFEVMETKEYKLRALFTGRFSKATRYRFLGEVLSASDPLANIDGGFRSLIERTIGTEPGPGTESPWRGEQYFELYRTRFGDLTNQPTDGIAAKAWLSYTPKDSLSYSLHGSYVDQKNDETEAFDWEKDKTELGASMWWAPTNKLYATASVNVLQDDVYTGVSIPVFDG